jgi:site-specific DNA recombinase
MNNAVIYARVSSKDQETEGFSIPAQLKVLHEYAINLQLNVVKEFTDTETAKKTGRIQFNAMVALLKQNKQIQHLLVEKTDRLTRNFFDFAVIEDLIKNNNLQLHLIKENKIITKNSRANEWLEQGFHLLIAKNGSEKIAEEVVKGMDQKATQGLYPSGAAYGYINVRESGKSSFIKVNTQAAPYVIKMFELYATGSYSLSTLHKKMIDDGMVYKNGKKFHVSNLEFILKNRFYTGVFIWKGKLYENAQHEPLVSKEIFQRVQNILTNPYKSKSRKELFPFTNLISCGLCGCKFTAELKKEKYIYYHCSKSKGKCKQDYLTQETIDDLFTKLFEKIQINAEVKAVIMGTLRDNLKYKIEYHNNLIDQLTQQIKRLNKRLHDSYIDKMDEKIDEAFWQSNKDAWTREKEELSVKLAAIEQDDVHYLNNASLIIELCNNAAQMFKSGNVAKKRRVIDMMTSNCTYKDGNIDVELKPVFDVVLKSAESESWCAR